MGVTIAAAVLNNRLLLVASLHCMTSRRQAAQAVHTVERRCLQEGNVIQCGHPWVSTPDDAATEPNEEQLKHMSKCTNIRKAIMACDRQASTAQCQLPRKMGQFCMSPA